MPAYQTDEFGLSVDDNGRVPGGLNSNALDVRAKAEASFYSLLNPYLSDRQKALVEVWYQLPAHAFVYSYLLFSAFTDGPLKPVFLAIYLSLLVGWLTTLLLKSEETLELILTIFSILNFPLIPLALISWAALSGTIGWFSAIAIAIINFIGLPNAGCQLASAWVCQKHPRVNPKYAAAKEIFGIKELPFEKYLQNGREEEADISEAKGKKVLCFISLALLVAATVIWGPVLPVTS